MQLHRGLPLRRGVCPAAPELRQLRRREDCGRLLGQGHLDRHGLQVLPHEPGGPQEHVPRQDDGPHRRDVAGWFPGLPASRWSRRRAPLHQGRQHARHALAARRHVLRRGGDRPHALRRPLQLVRHHDPREPGAVGRHAGHGVGRRPVQRAGAAARQQARRAPSGCQRCGRSGLVQGDRVRQPPAEAGVLLQPRLPAVRGLLQRLRGHLRGRQQRGRGLPMLLPVPGRRLQRTVLLPARWEPRLRQREVRLRPGLRQ
mmetsp:Transcript_92986/g.263095  ORF Transcript_92986/g.263095 Transcript_92986/m.263095 type:complete len:257 (+) Transcript_92986:536-1306(+)